MGLATTFFNILGFIVLFIIAGGVSFFYLRPLLLKQRLFMRVQNEIKIILARHNLLLEQHQRISHLMAEDPILLHLWSKYEESLNEQVIRQEKQVSPTVQIRATLPANQFFNLINCIEIPQQKRFFQFIPHLISILGFVWFAFSLLQGISHIKLATQDFGSLIYYGTDGILMLMLFIVVALLISFTERWLLARLDWNLMQITQLIDGIYTFSLQEEYFKLFAQLQRQTHHEMGQLKVVLRDELNASLNNLLNEQMQTQLEMAKQQRQAFREYAQQMNENLTEAIQTAIAMPLLQLSQHIEKINATQQQNVRQILSDLTQGFLNHLAEHFDAQFQKTNHSLHEATLLMQNVNKTIHDSLEEFKQTTIHILEESHHYNEIVQQTARESILHFNQGAKQFAQTVESLPSGTAQLITVLEATKPFYTRLEETGMRIEKVTTEFTQIFAALQHENEALRDLSVLVQSVSAQAKVEVGLSQNISKELVQSAQEIKQIEGQLNNYLGQISSVLTTSFNEFGSNIQVQLNQSYQHFNTHLTESIKLLASITQELAKILPYHEVAA